MRGAKRAYFSLFQLYEQLYKEGHISLSVFFFLTMLKNLGFLVSPKGRSIRIDSSARTHVQLVHRGRLCSRLLSLIQIGGKKTLTKSTNKFAETMMKSARKLLLFRSLLHHLTMPNASNNFHCLLLIFMLPWFRIITICLISNSHDDGGILFIILH